MSLALALELAKKVGPWLALALVVAAFAALTLDRNHLAQLNDRRVECTAAVSGAADAHPASAVCDAPVAQAAARSAQAAACDAALAAAPMGAPAVCSAPVQAVAAARDVFAGEVADRDTALAQARTDQAAAVSRATARATASAQQDAHADQVLASAPRDGGGALVLDADRLRDLAGPDPAVVPDVASRADPR